MSFHSGKKPCRVLYYLYHNHKVGFNLRSGMPMGWPSGKLGGWSRDHFTLKKTQWELKGIISPETVLRTHWIGKRYLILANSLELQNWFLFSFFSFLLLFKNSRGWLGMGVWRAVLYEWNSRSRPRKVYNGFLPQLTEEWDTRIAWDWWQGWEMCFLISLKEKCGETW